MIVYDGTNPKVEQFKEELGISGDVYIDDGQHIESLYSHQRLLTSYGVTPTATTIEEAEVERARFEDDLAAKRAAEEKKLTLEDAVEMLNELGGRYR